MPLELLSDVERRALDAYVALLHQRLGDNLLAARVFGSVARGERWWPGMPIRSDLDLLVLVREPLEPAGAPRRTYLLFLESGRQLGHVFETGDGLAESPLRPIIEREGVELPLR